MKSYVKSYECCTYPKVCINYVYMIYPNPNPNPISSRPPLPPLPPPHSSSSSSALSRIFRIPQAVAQACVIYGQGVSCSTKDRPYDLSERT